MAKLFRTSGTGAQQQTLDTTDEKIKIYADDTALDTDLTNIPDGEIVATKESASGGGSGYVGEIPLGTWASFENDTAPNSEWIQAGTTFDANVYPALAMMLGGNTVPERFDHNRQSEWEEIISYADRPVSNLFPYTSTKDGLYNTIITTSENRYVTVNGTIVAQTSTAASNNITFYANKGDIINLSGSGNPYYSLTAAYFEHPLFIKATPTSNDSDYEGTLNSIRDFYVRNNTYSTEERLTGGYWIDGKPIYRRVLNKTTTNYSNNDWYEFPTTDDMTWVSNISSIIDTSVVGLDPDNRSRNFTSIYCRKGLDNKLYYFATVQADFAIGSKLILEYTKTTD